MKLVAKGRKSLRCGLTPFYVGRNEEISRDGGNLFALLAEEN